MNNKTVRELEIELIVLNIQRKSIEKSNAVKSNFPEIKRTFTWRKRGGGGIRDLAKFSAEINKEYINKGETKC
jgi:hypothetical protein